MKKFILLVLAVLSVVCLISCNGEVDKELFGTEKTIYVIDERGVYKGQMHPQYTVKVTGKYWGDLVGKNMTIGAETKQITVNENQRIFFGPVKNNNFFGPYNVKKMDTIVSTDLIVDGATYIICQPD